MVPGIDPKVDYAFKRLFGREQNVSLLIHLLNAIRELSTDRRIVAQEILNPFHDKDDLDDKLSVLDIKARDQSGRMFNIEMQLLAYGAFRPRVLYYWAKLYQSQMLEGMEYESLRPTISICFVNTPLFPETPEHHLVFELRERHHAATFTDHLQVHILELAKFKLQGNELVTPADPWLYFLCHGEELDTEALPPSLNFPEIHKAMGELQMMTQSQLERERYEAREKMQRDIASAMGEARREGQMEGRREGQIHLIRTHQRMLQLAETPPEQLRALAVEELERLAQQLESEISKGLARP